MAYKCVWESETAAPAIKLMYYPIQILDIEYDELKYIIFAYYMIYHYLFIC